MRLHRQYGYGLSSLRTAVTKDHHPYVRDGVPGDDDPAQGPKDGYEEHNGVYFNPKDQRTFALGVVAGLQFNNDTYGDCFYAVVDGINTVDNLQRDFARILQTYRFFDVAVYHPTRVAGNMAAIYE